MSKRIKTQRLGRTASHKKAMIANMASSLILNEYIVTTSARAKVCKSVIDRVIHKGKEKTLVARRRVRQVLIDPMAAEKVCKVLAERFKDRESGFASMVRIGKRAGDNASMVKLVLIGSEPFRKVKKAKSKKKASILTEKSSEKSRKGGVLNRVKEISGRIVGRGGKEEMKDKARKSGGESRKVMAKSRSGL